MNQKKSLKDKTASGQAAKIGFSKEKLLLLLGGIVLLTFFCFSPVLKNGFINWDDNAYVFENEQLSKPLPEATAYFFGPHPFIGNYIPLTMVVYALEYHAAGLKPYFFHLVNLLIHLMNVVLVFWLVYLLSRKKPVAATCVAILFAIHPMHVESVAWVSELKDLLYGFFFISALIAYHKFREKKNRSESNSRFPFLVMLFFLLSLLCKPAAVTLPLVLVLLDYYNERKFNKELWMEKIPFFFISLVFGIIAVKAQQMDYLLHDYFSLGQRILFASHSFLGYLVKLVLPNHLSIFYPYPVPLNGKLPADYYFAPVLVILLAYLVYRSLKKSRLLVFGFLFFTVNIILVLQLVSVGEAAMADRYSYISYLGLFFIIGMGIDRFYNDPKQLSGNYKPVALLLLGAMTLGCSYLTYARCKVWNNDDSMATDLLEKFPEDRLALNNKGFILFSQGRYDEAIPLYTKAVQLKKDYSMAYINLINTYLTLNNTLAASAIIDTALIYVPNDFNILAKKGNLLFQEHKYKEAIEIYRKAIRINEENIQAYIYLSECYYALNDYPSGLKIVNEALTREPGNYILLNNKGYFLFLMHQYPQAVEFFKASLEKKPGYSNASINLSNCYKAMSDSVKTN